MSRISAYEQKADEVLDVLFYADNVTDDEKDNALVALARIVGQLQSDVERLRVENQKNKN